MSTAKSPKPSGWYASSKLDDEDVKVAWQYVVLTEFPREAEHLLPALRRFSPDAIIWVCGHPAVRRRKGLQAVEALHKELIRQAGTAQAAVDKEKTLSARRAQGLDEDPDEQAGVKGSAKPSTWRLGRSPGSYGGGRLS